LGISLYSNAAAVLSEVVANAWDADANAISISWSRGASEMTIEDDGVGMSTDDLNQKFLTVGYQKRDTDGVVSSRFSRPYMGRKGIGKLSIFSLANEVDIVSRRDGGEPHALRIVLGDLRNAIREQRTYHPDALEAPADFPAHGTRIILRDLNARRLTVSLKALRRRLARRFDVLQFDPTAEDRFQIVINGDPVGFDDREDLKRLEYIWTLGDSPLTSAQVPSAKKRWRLDPDVDSARGWKIGGWFGTVKTPKDLQDDEDKQESLRNIIILARRRPIQEGILDQLNFNKIFGNYVTGQITAEFLDDDNLADIATSDRQRLMDDDERVVLLRATLRARFLEAEALWSEERPKQKFIELTADYPLVHDWALGRETSQRDAAVKLIQTIASITLDTEASRRELFRAGILGFERIALNATTEELGRFAEHLTADDILPLLANQRTYEDALYGQILRSRIAAIEQLERLIDGGEKERALQEHLFANMWLLDPSWEHATADAAMEISLRRIRNDLFTLDEEAQREQGRIDIKYRAAAGTHMIVELKRYDFQAKLDPLYAQGAKYWEALRETLDRNGTPSEQLAVVFVLGMQPDVGAVGRLTASEIIERRLEPINGRVLYYDTLLNNAKRQYAEYMETERGDSELTKVLDSLEDEAPDTPPKDLDPAPATIDIPEAETPGSARATPAQTATGTTPTSVTTPRPSPALLRNTHASR
jgi:hypothetical protein